jgi:hypothetical protein
MIYCRIPETKMRLLAATGDLWFISRHATAKQAVILGERGP